MDLVKDMMRSDILTGLSAHSYYRYIGISEMILRHERALPLMKSLNAEDAGSKSLEIAHLDAFTL